MRRAPAVAVMAVLAAALAGCSAGASPGSTSESAATPDGTRDAMVSLVQDTQHVLGGGRSWHDGATLDWDVCVTGAPGDSWSWTRLGPRLADRARAEQAITALWKRHGMRVGVDRYGEGRSAELHVVGCGGPVTSTGVSLQDAGTSIDGESACFSGTPSPTPST